MADSSAAAPTSASTAAPPDEKLPRAFGRLSLLRKLARGGMGEVYLASTTGIEGAERPCVVKIIRREHAKDTSFLARFLDEARVQAQLQHPGVAHIVEASLDEAGEPYVVVEYVEGRTLAEVRARSTQLGYRIAWPEAVAIIATAADALAHVHDRTDAQGKPLGIVHRDLSPQNMMVGYAGDVKLIDFGTARGENRRCHTVSGVVFAKPGYVAPEIANGNPGDHRVDMYALGVMLWELLAGRRFLTGEPAEHLAAVAKDERRLPAIAPLVGAPAAVDDIVAKLTAHDREQRYPVTRKAAADLVRLLASAPSLPTGERGMRARIGQVMSTLYPAEPSRSRAEYQSLVRAARVDRAECASRRPEHAAVEQAPSPSPVDPAVLPGTRYRILRKLGDGAMGVVHEAEHVDLARRVALKVLAPEHATSVEYGARFRREARAIARLSHPGLVTIHDFGQATDGRLFCAMELLEGETLEEHMRHVASFTWERAVSLAIEACGALEAAHAAGVVHRDLKPANLFLPEAGGLKLLDFGIARARGDLLDGAEQEVRAQAGFALFGTPEYMAPEQARGGAIDGRADLYALGCVLYELCTGRLPFIARSSAELLDAKQKHLPEPPTSRARSRGLPAELDLVMARLLAPRAAARFGSAADAREALEALLAAPAKQKARRRLAGWVGAATASAVLVAAGFAQAAGALQPWTADVVALAHDAGASASAAIGALGNLGGSSRSAPARPASRVAAVRSAPDAGAPITASADAGPRSRVAPATPEVAAGDALPPSDPVAQAVIDADEALQKGDVATALTRHRELAARFHDPRTLEGWARAAAAARQWDEARRAAEQWTFVDAQPEARLFLARALAYSGRRPVAVAVLEDLLEDHPECDEARALLKEYGAFESASTGRKKARLAQHADR